MTTTNPGKCEMLIGDGTIVLIGRKYRSKWYTIHCVCSGYRRKDGSCKHERAVLEAVRQELRGRVRIGA